MRLDQPLSEPRTSRKLGPLSPEDARIEAKIRRRGGHESKYFGVAYDPTHDKWGACCRRQRVQSLETELEAALAHDRLALALDARDEPRNFPDLPLKPATAEELRRERRARLKQRTASAFMHVSFNRKAQLWIARVPHDSRLVDLGRYRDEEDAALAVDRALLHWGAPPVNLPRRAHNLGPLAPKALHEEAHRQIKATKSSRFRGVFWNSRTQSWSAQIMHRYRWHHLGFFDDETKAAAAYDMAAMKLHEQRAKLNFPQAR